VGICCAAIPSLRELEPNPWPEIAEKYPVGSTVKGKVYNVTDFGAFVELEPGIEGLIHISNLGAGRRINHPREVVGEGDRIQVRILSADRESRRVGLERILDSGSDIPLPPTALKEGDVLLGTIESVKDYGVFVGLPGGKSGLLHSSEISGIKGSSLRNRWGVGTQLEVQVLKIDEHSGRIALSTKSLAQRNEDDYAREFVSTTEGKSSFGKLGDLLGPKIR